MTTTEKTTSSDSNPAIRMRRARLYTADFGYVSTVEIPPFQVAPDVLTWGERVFKHSTGDRYVECFHVVAIVEVPGNG